jgi:hypothetical protein
MMSLAIRSCCFSFFFCFTFAISAQTGAQRSGPHLLVYKTRADYRHLVPVILSADKKSIVSFPAPSDLAAANGYSIPLLLHKNYLLDERGINKNVAFLKITYKEYAALKTQPPPNELYKLILDKDPLTLLCDCGPKTAYKDPPQQLNYLIDKKLLKKICRLLK